MATRLSVNINDETTAALQELAQRRDTSVTEVVRRAVAVYKFLEDQVAGEDKSLRLVDAGDNAMSVQLI